jgi:hypothetical protein
VQESVGVDAVPLAVKPKVVFPPGDSAPLYEAFVTVTVLPLTVYEPFHTELMLWPLASVHLTVQPLVAVAESFVTVTEA